MLKLFTSRLSLKVSFFVNMLILIVMVIGTYVLIEKQSKGLEQEVLNRVKMNSMLGAKMIGKIIEEAVDNGVFSVKDAFDTNYQKIGNFDPPKYHTKYDFYLDKSVLGIIDEFLIDDSIVFAVPVDKNGYLPTHNTRYQKPITNDKDKDKVGNRTKRIFDDPVGIKAAQNIEPGFVQVYHRDTGVTMWDISSPIYVKGQHWGGFRIGLSLVKLEKIKTDLKISLISIMVVILIISTFASFLIINKALDVLKR
ncbi:MAG: HAMP domain-containing protein, partial [bacterium]|nr:HAMP domain-containing protein [bacterium]